jgi:hypothetical protein
MLLGSSRYQKILSYFSQETAWWTWIHPAANPSSQQPTCSQVQNSLEI